MKKLLVIIVCIALLLSFSACANKPATDENSGTTENKESVDSSQTGEVTEIHFANIAVEDTPFHDVLNDAVTRYNQENEGKYKIINDALPNKAQQQSMAALAATNEMPEMSMVLGSNAVKYGKNGVVLDIADLIKENGIYEKMNDGAFSEMGEDEAIYGIPWGKSYYGYIFYNTEIFEKAGVEKFPANVDELLEAGEKIKAAGYIPMALGDKVVWAADSITFSSFVNKYVGNEWYYNIRFKTGKAAFTDEVFVNALNDFAKLGENKFFNENLASIDNNERLALYMDGSAAMISSGQWENGIICNSAPEIAEVTEIAAWPGPVSGAKTGDSMELSCAWAITLGSNISEEAKTGAMKFLTDYFVTDEWGKTLTETQGQFAAWDYEFDYSKLDSLTQKMAQLSNEITPCDNWDSTLDPAVKEVYQRGLQELLLGMTTAEKLSKAMQYEYETIME